MEMKGWRFINGSTKSKRRDGRERWLSEWQSKHEKGENGRASGIMKEIFGLYL